MTEIFKMPDIGEGMAEGDIANWLVKVGDDVKADDPVAEVQNDKLMQEILSPYSGKVTKLFVEAGATVNVGDPLIEYDGNGESPSEEELTPAPVSTTVENSTRTDILPDSVPVKKQLVPPPSQPLASLGDHVLVMPSVRHYARQHNIDLNLVPATGRHGHITLQDVKNFSDGPGNLQPSPSSEVLPPSEQSKGETGQSSQTQGPLQVLGGEDQTVSMTPTRKAIAKAMNKQHSSIPAVTNFDQVEVSKLVAHRSAFKDVAAKQDIRLTYLAYVTKALAQTARKFPEINASVKDTDIIYHAAVNVGIAVDAPAGLYVPVIKHADTKSILSIAKEIVELADAVREGTIKPAQMQGSTITISNIGSARGTWFTPIINGSDVVILGLGSIVKEPIVDEKGDLTVGQNMKLSMTYDHRLIDGMLGQTSLNYLKSLLADPAMMLMEI